MSWNNFKEKLGYGALKEESNIMSDLEGAVKTRHGFDSVISQIVTSMLMQIFLPWIDYCFNKYTEEYFHIRMAQGFSFMQDWQDNHPGRYVKIIRGLRAVRRKINFDKEKILAAVVKDINKRGWTVTDWEKDRLREDIAILMAEIYSP